MGNAVMNGVYKKLASENADITFTDITTACGGSAGKTPSKAEYFLDGIHYNKRGYCMTIAKHAATQVGCSLTPGPCLSTPPTQITYKFPSPSPTPVASALLCAQAAFGCQTKTYTCSSVPQCSCQGTQCPEGLLG